jgi:AraC family transcriptional regulator
MRHARDAAATVNPHHERSLFSAQALAAWSGFPIGWVEASPAAAAGAHTVDKTLLAMLDTGAARAEFGYTRRSACLDLSAGAMGLFVAGTDMHHCRWRCDDGVRRIMIELRPDRLADPLLAEQLHRAPLQTQLEFRDDGLAAVLRSIVREVAAGCPNGALYAESLSLGIALRLQQRGSGAPCSRERGKLSAVQAQRIEELVRSQLAKPISLRTLADAAGFSSAQFVRLFKNTFGCTPHHYVLRTRLARSRDLVLGSSLPLATIADEAGFASQSHMTSAFVRAYKTPPGQMRREATVTPQSMKAA